VLDSLIDAEVPIRLRGDSGRLCQVLTNLIGNAVKFTANGEATVRVDRVDRVEGDASHSILRFQVRDTGIGIPIDGQRNIFQAFTQADTSTTRRFGGTGLGLTISAQLVELMGGSIGVDSESGHGSTFWFTASFSHQQAAVPRNGGLEHLRLDHVRVLVVDGSETSARMMSDHLRAWGMRCEIVAGMAQALSALKQAPGQRDPFQIAIIDLQLREREGLDLAQAIRALPDQKALRVLGLYALGSRPDQALASAAGIRALLSKPVRQSDLFNTLNALMAAAVELLPEPHRGRLVREIKSVIPPETRQRTRILLVEDNIVNQQVEMRIIDRIGYHAVPVDNGRIALERLEHTAFDIILMDCQMPEVDGYTATREIRRREGSARHTPIIGVTAHALAGDREECLRAGMDDYIAKPVTPEDLAAIIDKWVAFVNLPLAEASTEADGQGSANPVIPVQAKAVLDETVLAELREYQNPGEGDFVTELIGIFSEDLTDRLVQISTGLEAGDANRVRQAAHALKGSSGELGAQRMREICARLESSAAEGSIVAAPALAQELEDEAVHVRAALAAHCVEVPARNPAA
jgi:two-component system, sensor histidine kinase and response regulator